MQTEIKEAGTSFHRKIPAVLCFTTLQIDKQRSYLSTTPFFLITLFLHHLLHQFPMKPHHLAITYDTHAVFEKSLIPCKIKHLEPCLFLKTLHHLEDIKLQIVRFIGCPQNRMVRCLGTVFYLTQTYMSVSCRLSDGLRKELRRHKM